MQNRSHQNNLWYKCGYEECQYKTHKRTDLFIHLEQHHNIKRKLRVKSSNKIKLEVPEEVMKAVDPETARLVEWYGANYDK